MSICLGLYAATKSALRAVTETLYSECKPLGVDVMLIEPGGVKSNVRLPGPIDVLALVLSLFLR